MRLLVGLFLAVLLVPAVVCGHSALDDARLARQLLGPDIWSQVIRVENGARVSRYPKVVHALVFELAGILWFYTATDGTQSFSLHRDRLEAEKADFGPLLKDIDPGFLRWSVVSGDEAAAQIRERRLPNGCFIDCVAALRARLASGELITRPRLLSYYPADPANRSGHTVLMFESRDGVRVIDPLRPRAVRKFPGALAENPLGLAQALDAAPIGTARLLPIETRLFRTEIARAEQAATEAAKTPAAGA